LEGINYLTVRIMLEEMEYLVCEMER